MSSSASDLRVYGTDRCEDTSATRNHLDSLGVQYEYLNLDHDAEAKAWVEQKNGRRQKTPTLDVRGDVLVEPDERELELALRGMGLMA